MKRGLALALLALATSVVASAQAHGGHASAGASRGGSFHAPSSFAQRGFAGGFSAGHAGGGVTFGHHPGFVTGPHGRGPYRRYYPGIGYYYYPYYWPYYGYYPYDNSEAYDSNAYQQNQPAPESPPDDYYGGTSNWRNQPRQAQAPPASPQEQDPTVLVFRDGHQQEVRNYAIVGQMLWDFGAKGTHKIPLAELDLDATRKLNDERGMEFVLPKT